MGVVMGKYGVVDGVSSVLNWTISDEIAITRRRLSNTKAGSTRAPGVKAWTGSFVSLGKVPAVMPGADFDFAGFIGPDSGIPGETGVAYEGSAMVDSVSATWNWGNNEPLAWTVNFSGHLDVTINTAAIYTDDTNPDIRTPCDFGGGPKFSTTLADTLATIAAGSNKLTNVVTAALTITAENGSYVNSDTDCNTGRLSGTVDWSLAIVQQDTTRQLLKGAKCGLILPVGGGEYWGFRWGMVRGYTGVGADNDGAGVYQHTFNIDMHGVDATAGAGQIILPGESADWWPVAVAP
jgi:hypothetical protein